ncbi:MAG: glycosyltransferase family 4 protein [Desulfobacter postgatei]|nr:glycosyltransferase family 4 protein [Desulfobacter postgatei]
MKILMISTSYPRDAEDWRARFVSDLVCAMAKKDQVQLYLWAPPGDMPSAVRNSLTNDESIWLANLTDRGGIAHVLRTEGIRGLFIAVKLLFKLRKVYLRHKNDADIIHVNWMQNALALWRIPKPAVISVLGSDYGLLRLPGMIPLLRKVIRQRRCILAPNADWMVEKLKKHFGDIAEIRCIPFGIKDMWFDMQRNQLSQEIRKWIVVSRVTKKKIGPLFSWGEINFRDKDELHLFGPMQEQMTIPDWVHHHGPTNPAELHDKWFPDATGLITLSEHDEGRPQVMLEAMAAKLPIIASDIAAHRNMIEHRQTGWITKTREDFQDGLGWLTDSNNNKSVGLAASEWARKYVGTWDGCAERYLAAYEKLIGIEK